MIFWDSKRLLLINYLAKHQIMSATHYVKDVTIEKPPVMTRRKVLFHRDQAPSHTCRIVQEKLDVLRFQILPQSLYSLNLALYSPFIPEI